jgi:hypothetical protein
MLKKISQTIGLNKYGQVFRNEIEQIKLLQAKQLVWEIKKVAGQLNNIHDAEFSVFSQWGDDGIIQYLIHTLQIKNKRFIEFGVGNYLESNTRFLLMNDNWQGLVMDGSQSNIDFIKKDNISWKYSIDSVCAFITRENINDLIKNAGYEGEIGLLHIDIDGNDYWVWEAIHIVNPQIVILEYNNLFGIEGAISVPYKPDFHVTTEHFSNLYFGASLKAFNHLAEKKGYALVGSNSNGNNLYFVRNDVLNRIEKVNPDDAYVSCNFRQNRQQDNSFSFKDDKEMIKLYGHLSVVDVRNNELKQLKDFIKN